MQYINPNSIIQNAMRNKLNPIKYTAPYVPKSNGLPTNNEVNEVLTNYMTSESAEGSIPTPEKLGHAGQAVQVGQPEKFNIYIPPKEEQQIKSKPDLLPKKIENFIEPYTINSNSNTIIYIIIIVILCCIIFKMYFKVLSLKMKVDILNTKCLKLKH